VTISEMTAAEIRELLVTSRIGRLACAKDGRPYVVPVFYAYDEDDRALLLHSLEGEKVAIMRENPEVCVQVDTIEHLRSWRSAVVRGRFVELKGDAARRALDALVLALQPPGADLRRDPFAPPGMEDRAVIYRIDVTEMTGRIARPR
jgi:nitroimidazol reductase NimA-like FMN-containing flavoprotein (pyridoxamine 5'-phosphate oxidase superfamily)